MLLLKKKEMFPTEMAEHFNFTLSTFSSHLPLLKDADLITGKKTGFIHRIEREPWNSYIFLRIYMTIS